MGDRFYLAQLEATGSTVGIEKFNRPKSKRNKPTKQELVKQIGAINSAVKDIDSLLAKDLEAMLDRLKSGEDMPTVIMPEGRLKKPYISACSELFPEVSNFSKCTVLTLKSIIINYVRS